MTRAAQSELPMLTDSVMSSNPENANSVLLDQMEVTILLGSRQPVLREEFAQLLREDQSPDSGHGVN